MVDLKGLSVSLICLAGLADFCIGVTQFVPSIGIIRIYPDCLLIGLNGLSVLFGIVICVPFVVPRSVFLNRLEEFLKGSDMVGLGGLAGLLRCGGSLLVLGW